MSKRVIRSLRTALLIMLVALLAGTSAFADSIAVQLNATTKVYQAADASSKSIKLPKNMKLTLKGYSNGWGQVTYKGHVGYIRLKYLDRVTPVKASVTENAIVYRDAAGTKKLGAVSAGATVYVVGVDGSFVRICNKSGSQKGYIKAGALAAAKAESELPDEAEESGDAAVEAVPESLRSTTTSPGVSKVEYAIYLAQNLLGMPYAASAKPPKTFDCAKFCYYCYTKAKSDAIQSTSYAQGYDKRYTKVSYDDLKRGDMVCFDTVSDDDQCDHTGIYIGGGYFIHASSAAKKVILSSLSSGYYKRTFSWGRRIFAD